MYMFMYIRIQACTSVTVLIFAHQSRAAANYASHSGTVDKTEQNSTEIWAARRKKNWETLAGQKFPQRQKSNCVLWRQKQNAF